MLKKRNSLINGRFFGANVPRCQQVFFSEKRIVKSE